VRAKLESCGGAMEKFIVDAVVAQPPTEQLHFEAIDTRND
jgi:hypothetical protein